jgi:Uma2 family endonuclease
MIRDGILKEDERIELIRGEIVEMSPINNSHAACVSNLALLLTEALQRKAHVWVQNPIWLDRRNRPQPDIALLRWRDDRYRRNRPTAADVILVVEVSDSSLVYDRHTKADLYAEFGIADYWIANVKENVIEVYSKPVNGKYQTAQSAQVGDVLSLPGGLEGTIDLSELF